MTQTFTFKCPLCDNTDVAYHHIPNPKHGENDTHVWVCNDCPFVGFEFWQDTNAKVVTELLTERTETFTSNRE